MTKQFAYSRRIASKRWETTGKNMRFAEAGANPFDNEPYQKLAAASALPCRKQKSWDHADRARLQKRLLPLLSGNPASLLSPRPGWGRTQFDAAIHAACAGASASAVVDREFQLCRAGMVHLAVPVRAGTGYAAPSAKLRSDRESPPSERR